MVPPCASSLVAMPGEGGEMSSETVAPIVWKTVVLRSTQFHKSVAVAIISNGDISAHNVFLELAPCHDHIYTTDCYRWLDVQGTHRIRGCERVQQLGARIFHGVPCKWIPGPKFKKQDLTASSVTGRVDIESCHTLVNIPWLMAYFCW